MYIHTADAAAIAIRHTIPAAHAVIFVFHIVPLHILFVSGINPAPCFPRVHMKLDI